MGHSSRLRSPLRPIALVALTVPVCLVIASSARAQDVAQTAQQPPTQPQAPTQPIQPEQPRTTPPQEPLGPFRDLFARTRREQGQTMTFSLAGYGGYDTNVIGDQQTGSTIDPRAQGGASSLIGTDAALQYVKTEHRASFAANVSGSYRYFPDKSSLSTSGFNAGAGADFTVAQRTRLRLNEAFSYQPYYQLGLFPGLTGLDPELGAAPPSNLDLVVLRSQSVLSSSSVVVEQHLSRRSSLTFDVQYLVQTLDLSTSAPDGSTDGTTDPLTGTTTPTTPAAATTGGSQKTFGYTAGVHFTRQLSRYMSLRLGDEYRRFVYPEPTRRVLEGNNIDAGVDYSRSLPFSRHTSLAFRTGSAIVTVDGRGYADVTGAASLMHQFTRNWQGSLAYNRDMSFVGTISEPLFADSASAGLQGVLERKLLVSLSAGFLSGRLGYNRDEPNSSTLRTGTAALSLAYALTSYLRATFDYSYFTYNFSNEALLPQGLQPSFDRNSVRGGLTLVLPLIGRP